MSKFKQGFHAAGMIGIVGLVVIGELILIPIAIGYIAYNMMRGSVPASMRDEDIYGY